MNGYELSRSWFNHAFENPEKIKPIHTAIFFFAMEHCNRLGGKEKFGFPSQMTMEAIGVKSYNTYTKALNEIIEFGFITMVEKSKNQYSANIISISALSKNDKARNKALDKATIKHCTKHTSKQSESTVQSIDSIDKPLTIEPITNNHSYSEKDFFSDWNELRTKHLKKPSHINSLGSTEAKNAFRELKLNYSREEIKKAMIGLFKQKKLPNGNTQMQSSPKHFLTHFEPYHTAYYDKNTALYGKIAETV